MENYKAKEDELTSRVRSLTQERNTLNERETLTITKNTSEKDIEEIKYKLKIKNKRLDDIWKELKNTLLELKKIRDQNHK